MATNTQSVRDILDDIRADELLEDRREYDIDMLQKMYNITQPEAEDLHYLIQREFDTALHRAPQLDKVPAETFKEYFLEAQHADWDGWDNEHDRLRFDRLLDDLRIYAKHSTRA